MQRTDTRSDPFIFEACDLFMNLQQDGYSLDVYGNSHRHQNALNILQEKKKAAFMPERAKKWKLKKKLDGVYGRKIGVSKIKVETRMVDLNKVSEKDNKKTLPYDNYGLFFWTSSTGCCVEIYRGNTCKA
eukprot:Gb_11846 [translate_table: standard]